jgi:hypothetical protein
MKIKKTSRKYVQIKEAEEKNAANENPMGKH